jgi:hypothetical protein
MHVRLSRPSERRARTERRPHVFGHPSDAEPDANPNPEADADAAVEAAAAAHRHEQRHRACVAPQDTAHYGCSCGFQFRALVSTSVICPHCGAAQAW